MGVDGVVAQVDFGIQLLIGPSFIRESSIEQCVEQYSKSPYICRWPTVLLLIDDLRGHVAGRATEHFDFPVVGNTRGESEIYEFDLS